MLRKPLAYALIFALAVVGCDGKKESPSSTSSSTPAPTADNSTPAETPGALKDLKIEDVKVGHGPAADSGDMLWMFYTGKLANGTKFDSTSDRGNKLFKVMLGQGQVIPGWDKGLVGMKVGGKRKLSIPASMAYGNQDKGSIPPNSDLYFDVELLALVKQGDERTVLQKDLKEGAGPEVKKGDKVTLDYVAKLPTGEVGDSTYDYHKPITFVVGSNRAMDGIDTGVLGMKVGGKREIIVPPALGPTQPTKKIPFDSVLTIILELRKIG